MTTEEIFSKISVTMIEGLMFHSQMVEYYMFLGLPGYAKCHEYHYLEESCNFGKINCYYIKKFNKLLPELRAEDPEVIPSGWRKYSRADVDTNTKRTAVKTGLEKWMAWEEKVLKLYEQMYQEAMSIDEVAAALKIKELVKDVSHELASVQQYYLNKKSVDYNISDIVAEQSKMKDDYSCKKRELFLS